MDAIVSPASPVPTVLILTMEVIAENLDGKVVIQGLLKEKVLLLFLPKSVVAMVAIGPLEPLVPTALIWNPLLF